MSPTLASFDDEDDEDDEVVFCSLHIAESSSILTGKISRRQKDFPID